ncbi:sodium-dependent bicarbonate transport family permease [Halomonas salifodinae]|uniref:sodium-dependent bicarbonate transport family permease n=1 Tax=Halomonas salifodinae TaxID=438745 RepID=UPI0033A85CF3
MPDIVVMFFLLGLLAGVVKSDLTIPKAAYDTLSLLLMLTIGLKGGMALYGNLGWSIVPELAAVAALGALIPLALMPVLRRLVRLSPADSASIAAHYGSVSAGTFAVALAFAEGRGLPIGAEVTLYLVMMELPAIMVAIALYRRYQGSDSGEALQGIWHETLTNRGVILLAGGAVIGAMYGPAQGANVTELFTGAFHAVLALFLLQMGLTAAETLRPIPWFHWRLLTFALLAPLVLSLTGLAVGLALGLPTGSLLILTALAASASYIAAPAAMRTAIPKANIGLAMLASLGFTFPLNVILGIPLYYQLVHALGG